MHDLSPREVCLACEEHVLALHLGDDIGMTCDLLMLDAFAINDLAYPDQVWGRTLKADDCVPWAHIVL
jgi:hypothetical protein